MLAKRRCEGENDGWRVEEVDLENIKQAVECVVCLSLFSNPKTLPDCGHSFCSNCLTELQLKSQRSSNQISAVSKSRSASISADLPSTATSGKDDSDVVTVYFPCPTCRFKNDLKGKGVEGIPINASLHVISQKFRLKTRPTSSQKESQQKAKKNRWSSSWIPSEGAHTLALPENTTTVPCLLVGTRSGVAETAGTDEVNRTMSAASDTSVSSVDASHCCAFFDITQSRSYCHHCKEKFCKRCELTHLENVKADVIRMGSFLTQCMADLPSATALSSAADTTFNKLSADLEHLEVRVADAVGQTYSLVSKSLEVNGEQLMAEANAIVHEETQRIEKLVKKWSREDWRADVIRQVENACHDIKTKPLLRHSLESVSIIFYYISMLNVDVKDLERLCQPSPEDPEIAFVPSDDFSLVVDRLGTILSIGRISSTLSSQTEKLGYAGNYHNSSKRNLDLAVNLKGNSSIAANNIVQHPTIVTPLPTPTPCSPVFFAGAYDKSFYENLQVIATISDTDCLKWDLKKPTAVCCIPMEEPLAAVVHNGTRITLVSSLGQMKATYRLRVESDECYLGQYITAIHTGTVFLTCHESIRIIYFNFLDVKNPKQATATVFVRAPSNGVTFKGLAVSHNRSELYTSTHDAILAYFTGNGALSFQIKFQDPSHVKTSTLQAVISSEASTAVVYTSGHGKVAWQIRLPSANVSLSNTDTSAIRLPLLSRSSFTGTVRSMCSDPVGNLLVSFDKAETKASNKSGDEQTESQTKLPIADGIVVFSPNVTEILGHYVPPAELQGVFKPLSFAVLPGEKPSLVVVSFLSNKIIVLS